VARDGKTNLDTQSPEGRRFLQRIVEDQNLIVDSFRKMYNAEDNEWRLEDPDVPDIPPILTG
jgi:hypothetical protein